MAEDFLSRDLITYDPLSETTRKERTALLGLSMLGIALVKVPLVPEKLALLGIEFAKVQQGTFVRLYALVILYYLFAFSIYALTDYVAWKRKAVISQHEYTRQAAQRSYQTRFPAKQLPTHEQLATPPIALPAYRGAASYGWASGAARTRALFEFALPAAFSLYSLFTLLAF